MEERLRIYREVKELEDKISNLKKKHKLFTIGSEVYYVVKYVGLKLSLELFSINNIDVTDDSIWFHLVNDKHETFVALEDLYRDRKEAIKVYNKMLFDTLVYLEENHLKDELDRLSLVASKEVKMINGVLVSQDFLTELVFKIVRGYRDGYSLKESVEIFYNENRL